MSADKDTFDRLCTRAEQLSDLTEAMAALEGDSSNASLIGRLSYLAHDLAKQVQATINELAESQGTRIRSVQ